MADWETYKLENHEGNNEEELLETLDDGILDLPSFIEYGHSDSVFPDNLRDDDTG